MKKHQELYTKFKVLLINYFGSNIKEYDEGKYVTISDSGIWISCDEKEMKIGYGYVCQYFSSSYDDIQKAIDLFFNLLTKRKRITKYYKGRFCYKHKTEIILINSKFENFGAVITWFFPYWKKTQIEIKYEENLVVDSIIAIETIKNNMQNNI